MSQRIGLLTTSFPRFEGDVAGSFVLSHAQELAREGHEVEVLAPEPSTGTPPRFAGDVRLRWVPYLRPRRLQRTFYGAGVPDNLRRDATAWLGAAPFVLAMLSHARKRVVHWDALVSHWALPCGLVAGTIAAGRPHVAVLHSADLHLLSRLPDRGVCAARIAASASQLRFVSAHGRDRFIAMLPASKRTAASARAVVAPMPIEAPRPPSSDRAALRRTLGLSRFTLLFVGRLVPIKGLAEAIEALRERDDLQLLVAGDGPQRARLERLARGARLNVRFLGTVRGAHKEVLFHAADALLLPSRPERDGRTEGAPLVIREAQARGLPVLASRTGGIPELLSHGEQALLFEPGCPHSLRAALDRVQRAGCTGASWVSTCSRGACRRAASMRSASRAPCC